MLLWYRQYPDLLRKLSKRAPAVVDLFCGGGGCSEGIRRAGMTTCGLDSEMQEDYVRRFGDDAFTQTDALVADEVRRAIAQVGAIGVGSSPPCKSHSTAPIAAGQASSAPPMIRQTHEMLTTLGVPFWVENVLGAEADSIDAFAVVLRGSKERAEEHAKERADERAGERAEGRAEERAEECAEERAEEHAKERAEAQCASTRELHPRHHRARRRARRRRGGGRRHGDGRRRGSGRRR